MRKRKGKRPPGSYLDQVFFWGKREKQKREGRERKRKGEAGKNHSRT